MKKHPPPVAAAQRVLDISGELRRTQLHDWRLLCRKDDFRCVVWSLTLKRSGDAPVFWIKDWNTKKHSSGPNEGAFLSSLQNVFVRNEGLSIPQLVLFDRNQGFLATRHFDGQSLHRLLQSRIIDSWNGAVLQQLDTVVEWLKCFQNRTKRSESHQFDDRCDATIFTEMLQACLDHEHISKSSAFEAQSRFLRCVKRIREYKRQTVLVHGDFNTSNVLSGPSGLCVIDFGAAHWGSSYWDVGQFCVSLLAMAEMQIKQRNDKRCVADQFLKKALCEIDASEFEIETAVLWTFVMKIYFCITNAQRTRSFLHRRVWWIRARFFARLLDRYITIPS